MPHSMSRHEFVARDPCGCAARRAGRACCFLGTVACLLLAAMARPARGELRPEQVALVFCRASKPSRELAEYYAAARGIPHRQILALDVPAAETISRADWEAAVRPAIRSWLTELGPPERIRCLVTLLDVPLRIGPAEPGQQAAASLERLADERQKRVRELKQVADRVDRLRVSAPQRGQPPAGASPQKWAEYLEAAFREARAGIDDAAKSDDQSARDQLQELERLYQLTGGVSAVVQALEARARAARPVDQELSRAAEFRRGELFGLRGGLQALSVLPESNERDQQVLALMLGADGLLGAINWIDHYRDACRKNETYASFDSELALVHWPAHALVRWQSNALHHAHDPIASATLPPTLMVCRLEAPAPEFARRMIDDAMSVERQGLEGTFYIDARGLAADSQPGSYGEYDQNLRDLAKLAREAAGMEVVLDNLERLFQPGECPKAALYCGWYSLANYVDAFEWKPGAVAYHIASGEAATLRNPRSNVWCKRMLESGVAATLGPVYEPYLAAFPKPVEFFSVLLTGRLTLAETYFLTNPYNSWVMVLAGDPLYNPFRGRPRLRLDQLPEPLRLALRRLE
jgi:uncharacterized protein (TIGR03790 family)